MADVEIDMDDLRTLVREELMNEAKKKGSRGRRYPDQFVTSKGKTVKYGSPKHVQDLEDTLERLKHARGRQHRGTPAKTDMTRAISRIRTELSKVNRYVERQEKA